MADRDGVGAFSAAIAEIDRRLEELHRARDVLVRLASSSPGDISIPSGLNGTPIVGDALAAVREQEFSGMSIAKAAQAFLKKIGRHEKTATIIEAIRKGGVAVRGKNPISTVYTTLSRRPSFVSLGKNYWDLAERRPDLPPGRKRSGTGPKRKARRPRRLRRAPRTTMEAAASA